MNTLFQHREPIGTGIYPLPRDHYAPDHIYRTMKDSPIKGKRQSIFYVHVPFCKKFCSYCGIKKFPYRKNTVDAYAEALLKEIRTYFRHFPEREISTIYFGGGTATLLNKENWRSIFTELFKFDRNDDYEITVEGTPDGFDKETLFFLRDSGVNRISIGVQSAVGKVNENVSRFYDLDELGITVSNALDIIGDTNIDLIYNLPGQTEESFEQELRYINTMGATHLTINPFVVIESAPIYGKIIKNEVSKPSEALEIQLLENSLSTLENLVYEQYTVRDFCKDGKKCQFIIRNAYCYDMIGIGYGSYGFINGTSYRNSYETIEEYIKSVDEHGFSFSLIRRPNEEEFMRRIMIQGFRLTDFSISRAEELHQYPLTAFFEDELRTIIGAGLVKIDEGKVAYSYEGLIYANNIRGLFGKDVDYLGFGLSSMGKSKRGNYE